MCEHSLNNYNSVQRKFGITFPAPLWPSRAVMWPEYMVKSSLSTASLAPPVELLYTFVKPGNVEFGFIYGSSADMKHYLMKSKVDSLS